MQKHGRMFWGILWLWLLLSSSFSAVVFAAPGEGDGGGGGPVVPLQMDWSYPANGENGVSVTPIIQCKYSHNVAQSNVVKRNTTLFAMAKLDGTPVAINVYAADAQLEFDKRQYIYIEPVKPLEYNTTYVIRAKDGIQAKNSMATEYAQSFQFTTCGRRMDFNETNVAPMVQLDKSAAGEGNQANDASTDPALDKTLKSQDSSVSENAPSDGQKSEGKSIRKNPIMAAYGGIGFLFILSVIVSFIRAKRQK